MQCGKTGGSVEGLKGGRQTGLLCGGGGGGGLWSSWHGLERECSEPHSTRAGELGDVGVMVVLMPVTVVDDNTIPQASVWAGGELRESVSNESGRCMLEGRSGLWKGQPPHSQVGWWRLYTASRLDCR